MEIHFYLLYALMGVSIALGVVALMKIKSAIYLLEQPVVKKMSPQLNLKPIKVDALDGDNARNARNGTPMNRSNAGRPEGRDGQDRGPREDRGGRDGGRDRDRGPRGERDGEGAGRGRDDRGPRGDRGDRGDRFGGRDGGRDRDRGGRDGHRHERGDRGPREGRREFAGSEREPAQAEASRPAPSADVSSPAPLAPRRPLPSTVDSEADSKPPVSELAVNEAGAADPFFGRDDSDIQHGRRNQMKKKPKFDEAEVEEKAATEESVK